MKILLSFILGVSITMLAFMQDVPEDVLLGDLAEKIADQPKEIEYSFYDTLPLSSITVDRGAYRTVSTDAALESDEKRSDLFYVQLGAFSKQEQAMRFRGKAILEGFMISDIFVESVGEIHGVLVGPFAHRQEAEQAIDWASEKNFSGLLLAREG